MTLVDTNVLSDVLTSNSDWVDWSAATLETQAARGPLLINDVVYAELSVLVSSSAQLDEALHHLDIELSRTPREALFLAGKAFRRYRRQGGVRTGVLPDFFIGAHAEVAGIAVLTRDPQRFRSYFPTVKLVTP